MLVAEPATGVQQRITPITRRPAAQLPRRLLWVAFTFFLAGVGVGTGWDRRWHANHPFEDFWSPPHLFIYTCLLLTVGTVAVIAFSPRLRARFGEDVRLPLIPFGLPAPMLLLACGLASLGLAGLLDGIWHTAFGLDETGWSLPHAMLGHGIVLTLWGFIACRVALGPTPPLSGLGRLLFGWALLATAQDVLGGPLMRNVSPRALSAIAALPVLAADPRAQHTFRIYLAWHIDRTNPLYLPLAAFTVGFGLALVRWLASAQRPVRPAPAGAATESADGRRPIEGQASWETWMLAPAAVVAFVPLLSNPQFGAARLWEPLPFLLAAGGFLLARRVGVLTNWAWMIAGWVTCFWLLVFVPRPVLALLAGPLALVGTWAGQLIAGVIERPSPRTIFTLTGVIAGVVPVLSGALDLYLRTHTP